MGTAGILRILHTTFLKKYGNFQAVFPFGVRKAGINSRILKFDRSHFERGIVCDHCICLTLKKQVGKFHPAVSHHSKDDCYIHIHGRTNDGTTRYNKTCPACIAFILLGNFNFYNRLQRGRHLSSTYLRCAPRVC